MSVVYCLAQSGKKKGKQKKISANKGLTNVHQLELIAARSQQHVSGGLYRLVLALKMADILPTLNDCQYDNEKVRPFLSPSVQSDNPYDHPSRLSCNALGEV